jgi:membrane-associated phospholipid phosphatase
LYNPPTVKSIRIAEVISDITRLPLLAVPLFVVVGVAADGWSGLGWAGLCLGLTSGLSLVYLLYLTRSGKVRDARKIPRSERVGPLRVVAGLHVGAFLIVTLLDAPVELRAILLSYAVSTVAFAFLTPVSNISLHAAGVSGAAVCLTFVFGAWAIWAVLLVPVVVWSRFILKRHTPLELVLGVLVGGGGTWLAFRIVGG